MANLLHISANEFPALEQDHHTKAIWRELAGGFHEYHILARASDNRFHEYREGNIYLHLVPKLGTSKSFALTSLWALRLIRKYRINVMLAQCPIFGGFTAAVVSRISGIPVMIEIHGMRYFSILDGRSPLDLVLARIIRYSLTRANKVRTLTDTMADMLSERNIVANVVTIPNRVNTSLFGPPKPDSRLNHPIRIISVGRFVWEKSFDLAIRAVKELREHFDVELMLIGGGPLHAELERLAGGSDYISLVPNLPQTELVALLRDSDIYIQPSVSEGMPRAILEAMALGLPVIATSVGGIPGVINHGENGLLIPPHDVNSLLASLTRVIEDDDLRFSLAHGAQQSIIEQYEWSNVFRLYRQELLDMVHHSQRPSHL